MYLVLQYNVNVRLQLRKVVTALTIWCDQSQVSHTILAYRDNISSRIKMSLYNIWSAIVSVIPRIARAVHN